MILALAAALATSWVQVAPSEQAAMTRVGGGLRLAWASGGQLFYGDPASGDAVPLAAGPDVRPAFLSGPGGLRVVTGGVTASSTDGVTWQVGANPASGEVSAAGELLAWSAAGRVRVGAFDLGAGATPSLAPGMVAWSSADGVRVRAVGPDGAPSGDVSTVPDGSGRPSLITRGGESFVAAGPVLWRVGSSSTLPLADAVESALSADPRGRVWAAWTDGARVYAARSDRDVSELGAPVDLGALPASSVAINATSTAAHVLAASGGVSYLRRVLPGLTLDERHRREIFTFSVTDAGDPVRGVVVKVGRRSGKTDRNGRVTLRVPDRRLRVTATLKGYSSARLTLK